MWPPLPFSLNQVDLLPHVWYIRNNFLQQRHKKVGPNFFFLFFVSRVTNTYVFIHSRQIFLTKELENCDPTLVTRHYRRTFLDAVVSATLIATFIRFVRSIRINGWWCGWWSRCVVATVYQARHAHNNPMIIWQPAAVFSIHKQLVSCKHSTTASAARIALHSLAIVPYSGKLSREKTFASFEVLWPSAKFRAWCPVCGTSEQSAKVFSTKIVFSTNLRKFSPPKIFPLFGTTQLSGLAYKISIF